MLLKTVLKKIGLLKVFYFIKNHARRNSFSVINIERTFPIFTPGSAGSYKVISQLTIDNINSTIRSLASLISSIPVDNGSLESFNLNEDQSVSKLLKTTFDNYGSDKSSIHDYHKLYGRILDNVEQNYMIFEIGLGTNNTNVASNMGRKGNPGASLRAFRDVYTNSMVFGADYDRSILFNDDRISTYFVDQTMNSTFDSLSKIIPKEFDLMIDDGLHSMSANINTLKFFMTKIKLGGYIVIEDIKTESQDIWNIVHLLLKPNYESLLLKTKAAYVFIAKRIK